MSIRVSDIAGKVVYSQTSKQLPAGEHDQQLKFESGTGNGIYILQLSAGGPTESFKFITEK